MSVDTARHGFFGAAGGIAGFAMAGGSPVVENEAGGFKLGIAACSLREFSARRRFA